MTTHLHTHGYISRLHPTSVIVTTALHVYLCVWADMAHDTDEDDGFLMREVPTSITNGDFLTAAHYARLYHLMKSVKVAHTSGRVTLEHYALYAEYFNAITTLAEAIHTAATLDEAVDTYTPPTTATPTPTNNGKATKKPSQMPNLLDVDVNPTNDPPTILPTIYTGIYSRAVNPPAWCVMGANDYAVIPIVDWLTADSPAVLIPYVDPFDECVEGMS